MYNYKKYYKYHYLYKIVNTVNNKYYIGIHSTNNLNDDYLGSGIYLLKAIEKYGKQNFKKEILKFCETRTALLEEEENYISKEIVNDEMSYNLSLGGMSYIDSLISLDNEKFIEFQRKSGKKGAEAFHSSLSSDQKKEWHAKGGKACHESYKRKGVKHPITAKETIEKSIRNRKVKGTVELWNPDSKVCNKRFEGYIKGDCVRVYKDSEEYEKYRLLGWLLVAEKRHQLWSTDSVKDHL